MGFDMAKRLAQAGCDIAVWNRTKAKAEPLAQYGATIVDGPRELATRDIVFCMVSTWDDVKDVTQKMLSGAAKPRVVVECSSISLEGSAELRSMLAAKGIQYLAAPVSGNAKVVKAGKLVFVVSGPRAAYDSARPYLDLVGRGSSYVGEGELRAHRQNLPQRVPCRGHQSMCEITILAQKAGMSRHAFLDFLNNSIFGCMFTRYKTPALVNLDSRSRSRRSWRKDVDLGLIRAQAWRPCPWHRSPAIFIQQMIGHGITDKDFAALLVMQAKASGIELKPENVPVGDGLSS
jgi:3-hydroxyisobutyrate dehydrogenase-like beta-hydroxyacid dehydrogenase